MLFVRPSAIWHTPVQQTSPKESKAKSTVDVNLIIVKATHSTRSGHSAPSGVEFQLLFSGDNTTYCQLIMTPPACLSVCLSVCLRMWACLASSA